MVRKVSAIFLVLFVSALLSSPVLAQRQTGSLFGTIVDQNGEPLPGCTLTILSPALLGTQNFVTTDRGSFRFPALPPGTYAVSSEMPGFKKITLEGIIINVGKTTTITLTMEQSAIEEEITVTTEAPIVDTKSTKVSVSFTRQILDNIPMGRDIYDVIISAPGAISEGVTYRRTSSVHGSTTGGSRYALDGLDMTDPAVNYPITNMSFDIYEEVEMEIGAHPADVGNVSGAYVNIVTRSGGNAFHGQGTVYYFNESFVDENYTKEQLDALGLKIPSKDKSSRDFSANIGGPVFKNKLWFFISGRYLDWAQMLAGFPKDVEHEEYFGFGKLTFQVTPKIKLMGYFNYVDIYEPYFSLNVAPTEIPQSVALWDEQGKVVNIQLNWVLSPNSFLDIRGMWVNRLTAWRQQPGATHRNYDRGTGMFSDSTRWSEESRRGRYQFIPSLTLFLDNFLAGNHELKIGGEFESAVGNVDSWNAEPVWTYSWYGSPYYYGGNRGQFQALAMEPGPSGGMSENKQEILKYAFYVQDNWSIKDRLSFNLGLRYTSSHGNYPPQIAEQIDYWLWLDPVYFGKHEYPELKDLISFNSFDPRLGLTFDVFGNGKTVTKASFSWYSDYLQVTFFGRANPNTAYSSQIYNWTDTNLNGQIDPADSFSKLSETGRTPGDPKDQFDPNVKVPYWTEFIVGVDHELMPNFRLGVSYIYKRHNNIYEDEEKNAKQNWAAPYTVTDPGYDGVFGTKDDSQLTVWDRTRPFEGYYFTNPKDAWRKYQALEFVFEKRMSNKWQLFGSIAYSKMWGTIGGAYGMSIGQSGAFNTPNWMVNREGRSEFDRPLVIKMQGTYQLPHGLNLSAYFMHFSGSPFNRTLNVYAPNFGGYVSVNAEEQGSRRSPSWNRLDLRLEKEFAFGNFGKLGMYLDVFNATNSGYIGVRSELHGYIERDRRFTKYPLWQSVSSVSSPRLIKLGVRFTF